MDLCWKINVLLSSVLVEKNKVHNKQHNRETSTTLAYLQDHKGCQDQQGPGEAQPAAT